MNNQFDEITKSVAKSVTRRGALKQFGRGLGGMALALIGLTKSAHAKPDSEVCTNCIANCMSMGRDRKWCRNVYCSLFCGKPQPFL